MEVYLNVIYEISSDSESKISRIQILKKPSKRNWIIVIPGNKYGIDEIPLKLRRYSNTMSVQQ